MNEELELLRKQGLYLEFYKGDGLALRLPLASRMQRKSAFYSALRRARGQ